MNDVRDFLGNYLFAGARKILLTTIRMYQQIVQIQSLVIRNNLDMIQKMMTRTAMMMKVLLEDHRYCLRRKQPF